MSKIINERSAVERKRITRDLVNSLYGKPMNRHELKRFARQSGAGLHGGGQDLSFARDSLAYAKKVIKKEEPFTRYNPKNEYYRAFRKSEIFDGNVNDKGPKKKKFEIPKIVDKPEKKFILHRIEENYKGIYEEIEELKTNLAKSTENIRLEYAKGIAKSIDLYGNLLQKSKEEYGIEDLVEKLEHHVEEDKLELEKAVEILDDEDKKELKEFQKELNTKKEEEFSPEIDISPELTKDENAKIDEEPTIEEKNEVTPEDTTFGASDEFDKYTDDMIENE